MKLIITVGLPGCGKSTYLEKLGANAISSDEMRRLLADDPTAQNINRRVFAAVRYLVKERLKIGRPETYVDATNLTHWERRPYIRLGQLYEAEVEAIFFDVPLEICMRRNLQRNRNVPEEALLELARKLCPPTVEEGFAKVTRIGVDC